MTHTIYTISLTWYGSTRRHCLTIVTMPSLRARLECTSISSSFSYGTLVSQVVPIHVLYLAGKDLYLTGWVWNFGPKELPQKSRQRYAPGLLGPRINLIGTYSYLIGPNLYLIGTRLYTKGKGTDLYMTGTDLYVDF